MSATYLSGSVIEQLALAQVVIDRHLRGCSACHDNQPCEERSAAEAVFSRYGCLPKRKPGLTRVGSHSGQGFKWFDGDRG